MKRSMLFASLFALSAAAHAVDGVILIDQAKALAGNVTPGDAPGFPVTLSKSGSYRLSGNLVVPDAYTTGIKVATSNVNVDLNGFGIFGPNQCIGFPVTSCAFHGSGHGVDASSSNAVSVRNGTVYGMGGNGLYLAANDLAEGVMASHNGGVGISVHSGAVRNCQANSNWFGMVVTKNAMVSGNTAMYNQEMGLGVGDKGVLVTGNTFSENGGYGIDGDSYESGYSNNVLSGNTIGKARMITNLGGNL